MLPSQVCELLRAKIERHYDRLIPPTVATHATLRADDHRHNTSDRLHQASHPYGLGQANDGELIKHLGWSLFMPTCAPKAQARVRDDGTWKVGDIELLLGYEVRASQQQADVDRAIDLLHRMVAVLWIDDAEPSDALTLVAIVQDHEVILLPAESLFVAVRSRFQIQFEGEL